MSGFDRIKPPEKRLLEREEARQPDSRRADTAGRAGLFSVSGEPSTPGAGVRSAVRSSQAASTGSGAGPRPFRVTCSRCDATRSVAVGDALKGVLPLALVAPWRSHPIFAMCPTGRHRAWLKVRLSLS
ncbi:hypothetical protein [Euzebya tangerina]|uniref:hypothetical protein n=1 Tax=Euzebya tangerina TaxID=591198 RepID=UPI000E320A6A|nr:hypothetical protein [Euzebya tangerina]